MCIEVERRAYKAHVYFYKYIKVEGRAHKARNPLCVLFFLMSSYAHFRMRLCICIKTKAHNLDN